MIDLLLPDQLQLLLENPQDGDVPFGVYAAVSTCVKAGLAWELEYAQAVTIQGGTITAGSQWPPDLGDDLGATLTPLCPRNGHPAIAWVRKLDPVHGTTGDLFTARLQARGLVATRTEKRMLGLGTHTLHPLSPTGQQARDGLQRDVRCALEALHANSCRLESAPPRTWMTALLVDAFHLTRRSLGVEQTKNVEKAVVDSVIGRGLMSLGLADVIYHVAYDTRHEDSPLTLLAGVLDILSLFS